MNSSTLTEHLPLAVTSELQMQRERAQMQRDMFATMQSTINVMTDEMRPKQEDESIFLTPKSSPYSPNGAATYDIPVTFPELSELDGGHPGSLQPPVPTSPYMCGSPEETAYMNNPYGGSPPYSPPYDNSPLSVNGSCSSPGSCSSLHRFGSTDLCSPTPSVDQFPHQFLPPQTSIPSTSCNSMPFSTGCNQMPKNTPGINTIAYPQQPQAWMFYDIPTVIEPSVDVPIEAPIIIHDRQQPITFYPPSPQPGAMSSMYHESPNMYEHPYPPMNTCFAGPSKIPIPDTKPGQRQRKPRPPKPPIQVDDSDIKDIPSSAQLWEFTLRVLKKPKYNNMVCWENQKEGLFRFHDAQAFAALWGKHRNRPNMTYDKVARALRYYYKRNIFKQVGGRLTYRFSDRLRKLYQSDE